MRRVVERRRRVTALQTTDRQVLLAGERRTARSGVLRLTERTRHTFPPRFLRRLPPEDHFVPNLTVRLSAVGILALAFLAIACALLRPVADEAAAQDGGEKSGTAAPAAAAEVALAGPVVPGF